MCKDDPARRNQAAVIVAIRAGNHVHCLHELTTVTVRLEIDGTRRMLVVRSIGGGREGTTQPPRAAKPAQHQFVHFSGTGVNAQN